MTDTGTRAGKQMGAVLAALVAALVSCVIPSQVLGASEAKPGVVSLDYCADQYVLALADSDQIIALSEAATSEYSYHAAKAEGLPSLPATAEDVLLAGPDLVVRQWGGGYGAGPMLQRFGVPVAQVAFGETVESTITNLRTIGDAMGQRARAETLIADMKARLAQIKTDEGTKRRALYITPSGTTTGANTFVDAMIRAAGFDNMGAREGRESWYPINLEDMVLNPPDVIIGSFFDLRSNHANHWSIARHSLLREMLQDRPAVLVPSRMIACSAWFFVDAVELIDETLNIPHNAATVLGGQP